MRHARDLGEGFDRTGCGGSALLGWVGLWSQHVRFVVWIWEGVGLHFIQKVCVSVSVSVGSNRCGGWCFVIGYAINGQMLSM